MARIIKNSVLTRREVEEFDRDTKAWVYNGLDVCVTHEIWGVLRKVLDKDETANKINEFSKSLRAPVFDMERRGMRVDRKARLAFKDELGQIKKRLEGNLERILRDGVGLQTPFNYRSHPQIKDLLYRTMQFKAIRARDQSGKMAESSNRESLNKLMLRECLSVPVVKHILALRDCDKCLEIVTTKIDRDWRIRSTFNIGGTVTGRFSSKKTAFGTGRNVQNIKDKYRRIIVPDPGMKICNIDAAQADSRNAGAAMHNAFLESHGPEFASAYLDACESADLHTFVCRLAFTDLGWPEERDQKADRAVADIEFYRGKTHRDISKNLGHGTNYQTTTDGTPANRARELSLRTHTNIVAVYEFQQAYLNKAFPAIPKWHQWTRSELFTGGTLTTIYGRRRTFYGRRDEKKTISDALAYQGQSPTADFINHAMLNFWNWQDRARYPIELLNQVHDSLIFQYPAEAEEEVVPLLLETLPITVPLIDGRPFSLPLEAQIGWNWGKAKFDKESGEWENPHGLIDWTGRDDRDPPEQVSETRSLIDELNDALLH